MTETLQKRPEAEAPEAATEPAPAPETELVECVVLTGPRRGEIVTVNLERQEETWTEEEMDILVDALRKLDQALVGLLDETKSLGRQIRAARLRVWSDAEPLGSHTRDRLGDTPRSGTAGTGGDA